jgi:hypothetical protein
VDSQLELFFVGLLHCVQFLFELSYLLLKESDLLRVCLIFDCLLSANLSHLTDKSLHKALVLPCVRLLGGYLSG